MGIYGPKITNKWTSFNPMRFSEYNHHSSCWLSGTAIKSDTGSAGGGGTAGAGAGPGDVDPPGFAVPAGPVVPGALTVPGVRGVPASPTASGAAAFWARSSRSLTISRRCLPMLSKPRLRLVSNFFVCFSTSLWTPCMLASTDWLPVRAQRPVAELDNFSSRMKNHDFSWWFITTEPQFWWKHHVSPFFGFK